MKFPRIVAISGVKNSGKTTLICGLLDELKSKGYHVGVIKHDGHSFEPDVPETDSFRFRARGADSIAVISSSTAMIIKQNSGMTETDIIDMFPDSDIILLEGYKYSNYDKIEIIRHGNSEAPVCDPATMLALVTDVNTANFPDAYKQLPVYKLSDYAPIADMICGVRSTRQ